MLEKANEAVQKAIKHLEYEYSKLQLGRANPALVEDIMVDQYGSLQPLQNMASVSNLDSQTLSIKPWDKTVITAIAKAISDAGLGLNPQTMADSILIKVPALTEERRKEIGKVAKKLSEDAKIGVRNARGDEIKAIKKLLDEKEISEDEAKDREDDLQKVVDEANKSIENHYKH